MTPRAGLLVANFWRDFRVVPQAVPPDITRKRLIVAIREYSTSSILLSLSSLSRQFVSPVFACVKPEWCDLKCLDGRPGSVSCFCVACCWPFTLLQPRWRSIGSCVVRYSNSGRDSIVRNIELYFKFVSGEATHRRPGSSVDFKN